MTLPRDTNMPDHLRTALEVSCGALMMLESIRARAAGGDAHECQVEDVIAALRHAINELRSARGPGHPASLGFVLLS